MKYSPHFDFDLKRGKDGENWFYEIIGLDKFKLEIKTDSKWPITGNIYVEYQFKPTDGDWRPSGIAITEAKYFVIKCGKHPMCIILETQWLRSAAIRAFENGRKTTCRKYSDTLSRGVLLTLQEIFAERDPFLDD